MVLVVFQINRTLIPYLTLTNGKRRWKIFGIPPSLYGGRKMSYPILENGARQTAKCIKWSYVLLGMPWESPSQGRKSACARADRH